jgi:hypothetical protein
MFVHDEYFWDVIGIVPYSDETYFELECRVMHWANDKIRVNFLNGVGGIRNIGKAIKTSDYGFKSPKLSEITKYTESETLKFSAST